MIFAFNHKPHIIIGMHRSGTTMLSKLLSAAGIFMGADLTGNHESWFFESLNKQLLEANGFSWDNPGISVNTTSVGFSEKIFVRDFLAVKNHPSRLISFYSGMKWGWKDPRNTFTLNHWLKKFPEAKVIHIYRNGIDVALSLFARNQKLGSTDKHFSAGLNEKQRGMDLWQKYLDQAFSFENILNEQMITLRYENLIRSDQSEISKLEKFVGVSLRSHLEKLADPSKSEPFRNTDESELIQYAAQISWMKKLNYLS